MMTEQESRFRSTLEDMPLEILHNICGQLAIDTVRDFTLVSKRCRSVAIGNLFRSISIGVSSRRQLSLCIEWWSQRLQQLACLGAVQRLYISGTMPREDDDKDVGDLDEASILHPAIPELSHLEYSLHGIADSQHPQVTLDEDKAWRPLGILIEQLSSVIEIHYRCSNQFSPCLLESLHQYHPACRLYLETFKFRSLGKPSVDKYEFQLATSPCLYSIDSRYDWDSAQEDAIFRTVSALAPNMKELATGSLSSYATIEDSGPQVVWVWPGFSLDKVKTNGRRGKLLQLKLYEVHLTADLLEKWNKVTDLTVLRTLLLPEIIGFDALKWVIAQRPFKSLTTLSLNFHPYMRGRNLEDEYIALLEPFMLSLPPLKSLTLDARSRTLDAHPLTLETLASILRYHGSSLQEFKLDAFKGDVTLLAHELRQLCPLLETLELEMRRTKGDDKEVAIYRALGSIPRLQDLSLVLDCRDTTALMDPNLWVRDAPDDYYVHDDPSFDEFDRLLFPSYDDDYTPRNGHVRDALINSAIDEALASSIFQCISSGKDSHSKQPLKRLQLSPYGGDLFQLPEYNHDAWAFGLSDVLTEISQHWEIIRHPRDDCQGLTLAKVFPGREKYFAQKGGDHPGVLSDYMKPVFRKLWPEKSEGSDWQDDWHSFPLQI